MRPLNLLLPALLAFAPAAFAADAGTLPAAPALNSASPSESSAGDDGGTPELPAGTIYLMTRVQLNGTDFGQVSFLQDKSITTLEACDKEREAGMTVGWGVYHPYLKTYKGMSYRVEYRCVVSDQRLSMFRYNQPLDNFYLVSTGQDSHLHLAAFRNFFSCRDHLDSHRQQQTLEHFCAKTGQRTLD